MLLRQIFDPKLAQYAYLIGCQRTGEALILDPERDIDRYLKIAAEEGLRITAAAETHIHADFLSGARELAEQTGAKLFLSDEGGADWKYEWARASTYDVKLLRDGDTFQVGNIELQAVHTPGHTPEHMSFLVTDRGSGCTEPIAIATGDFVFVGDLGRPDLLESAAGIAGQRDPSARSLYRSVDRFNALPDFLQVWPAHGAGSACGKALGAVPSSTVGYEKRYNASLDAARRGEDAFVESILGGQPEPPLYFANMKRLNRSGPPLLGGLPQPKSLTVTEVEQAIASETTVILDTRLDRGAFLAAHLQGSLYTPRNRTFPTVVGSYVRPEEEIILLVEGENVEETVRDLVRIGFDKIRGFVAPQMLADPKLAPWLRKTQVVDFAQLEKSRQQPATKILDVRGAAEYDAAHIPGSLNIAHTRLLDRLDEVPREGELMVYCRSGARAAAAVAMLERAGRPALLVDDHFAQWSERTA